MWTRFKPLADDPAMGDGGRHRARAFRVAALNSGMWLVMATHASRRLMAIMSHRMATEDLWDQAVGDCTVQLLHSEQL
jgi:hypothetical protein